nr:hypothetical protein [Tanacetum cinerariifolium]
MLTPTFAATHNLVAFLEKPAESAGFELIIYFLKSKPIHYALTVNPTIYVCCVKQFWATVKVTRVNDQEQIQALVDKQKVIITEDIIRSNLCFDDAEGTTCLPNEEIFEGLARMRPQKQQKPRRKQRKEAEVSPDESEDEDNVPTPSSDLLPSSEDSYTLYELMVFCTSLQEQGRKTDDEMFRVDDLTEEEVVTIHPLIIDVSEDKITMAQALAALKSVKPTIPAAATKITTIVPTPKAKEPKVLVKKKDQIRMDEESKKSSGKEAQERNTKRTTKSLESNISKKQKVDKNVDLVIDDTKELKKSMEIVPDDGDKMFKNLNREDVEVMWAIVQHRFKKEKLVEDMDNLLFRTLKTMFEQNVEDLIWTYQQGLAKVKNWKLYESCGMYFSAAERLLMLLEFQLSNG